MALMNPCTFPICNRYCESKWFSFYFISSNSRIFYPTHTHTHTHTHTRNTIQHIAASFSYGTNDPGFVENPSTIDKKYLNRRWVQLPKKHKLSILPEKEQGSGYQFFCVSTQKIRVWLASMGKKVPANRTITTTTTMLPSLVLSSSEYR